MEVTFFRPPLKSEEGGQLLPSSVPEILFLPHVIGRPVTGRSAGTGTLKSAHLATFSGGGGSEPNLPLGPSPEHEPIDIYIRPLSLKAGWIDRRAQQKGPGGKRRLRFRELVVAGLNGVPEEATVAGPCFLAAKLSKDTGYSQRNKQAVISFRTEKANRAADRNFFGYTFEFLGQSCIHAHAKS